MRGRVARASWTIAIAALLGSAAGAAGAQAPDPSSSVFQLLTLARDGAQHHSVYAGTAFFTRPDGTALTNAHVVRLARAEPHRYYLLAFVERYFFGAVVTCATPLPGATGAGGVEAARDLAVVRVILPSVPFRTLTAPGANGERVPFAAAWNSPMPEFPTLAMGPAPRAGDAIRIIGYGGSRTVPQRRVAIGAVRDLWTARDGTPVFSMSFVDPVLEGDSGAPILSVAGHVQGMFGWRMVDQRNVGVGITSSALQTPCGAP
jgi:hypothetical protein